MNRFIQNQIKYKLLFLVTIVLLPKMTLSTTIVKVDRAIHDGFELLIIHCDSLPEFALEYDRVEGIAELRLKHGNIARRAAQTLTKLAVGPTIRGATVDMARGKIRFRTPKAVTIRDYLISGPAALILDFGKAEIENVPLPFELDRDAYLKLGSRAERGGRWELALKYVEHVRGWEGSDVALTHRAGVIEQRLGRWDQALETLAESARFAEFAADAHARRTMIYLAKGDTAAMGTEWAGYFHADQKKIKPLPEVTETIVDTVPLETKELSTPAEKPVQKPAFKLPQILSAGGGNSIDYLYYGWGFLAVGFLSLIGLLLSARRSSSHKGNYGTIDITVPLTTSEESNATPAEPLRTLAERQPRVDSQAQVTYPDLRFQPRQPHLGEYSPSQPGAPEITFSAPSQSRQSPSKPDRVPVDEIVSMAESGRSEREIAHQLMVGRDEVAMVLNLSRLARRSSPPPQ